MGNGGHRSAFGVQTVGIGWTSGSHSVVIGWLAGWLFTPIHYVKSLYSW